MPPKAKSSPRRKPTRFGPRPYSDAFSRDDVHRAMQAFDHAEAIAAPLNTPFTITFQGSRPYDALRKRIGVRATEANTRACRNCVTRAIRDTAREFNVPLSYMFAFENPPQGGFGLHLHALLHVPAHCRDGFLARLDLKLRRALDSQPDPDKRIEPVRIEEEARTFDSALGWLGYFLKGWEEPQGRIYGPRLTIGRAINKAAQRQAGSSVSFTSVDTYEVEFELHARHRARRAAWLREFVGPLMRGKCVIDPLGDGLPAE